jgi:hypothetical protein
MNTRWALLGTVCFCVFSAANAQAAAVAVMPVQGVNLSEGQCDAIGVFFSNAYARDAHVAVASSSDTKPVWSELKASLPTATRLGAPQYVDLSAIRLGSKVTLAGVLHGPDGKEIYRAEASAPSLDEIDAAAARLARALIWRQPVPAAAYPSAPQAVESAPEAVPAPETPASPSSAGNMFGMKGAMAFPVVSGRTLSPQVGFQFDARIGPREHFMEVGAGFLVPTDDSSGSGSSSQALQITAGFIELGGSGYLTDGGVGLYVGGGVSPGLWRAESYYYDSSSTYYSSGSRSQSGAMLPVYAQIGLTFTRDVRTRVFAEVRLSQHLLSIVDPNDSKEYRPTVMALQMGVGW